MMLGLGLGLGLGLALTTVAANPVLHFPVYPAGAERWAHRILHRRKHFRFLIQQIFHERL